jgi:hypothetical protein
MVEIESLIAAAAGLAIAFGGYVQFVLRRSIYPCIEFDVELTCLPPAEPVRPDAADPTAPEPGERVAELVLLLRNVGPGVGFVDNVQGRVGCRRASESGAGPDGLEPALSFFLQPPPTLSSRIAGSALGSGGSESPGQLHPARRHAALSQAAAASRRREHRPCVRRL